MSAWIVIAAEDLNDYQVGKLVNAARTKALAGGQADPFDVVMQDVANRIRDDIRGCKSNRVSATPYSVPPGLRTEVILLTIEALVGRLPGVSDITDLAQQLKDAKDRLKRVAACKVPIEVPDDPEPVETVQRGGALEQVSPGAGRVATRTKMGGLT